MMTEDELIQRIEETMQAAHLTCQPWLLALAALWFPNRVAPTTTETRVTAQPVGGNAMVRSVGFSIQPAA